VSVRHLQFAAPALIGLIVVALMPGSARAGGLGLYEVGAPDLGTASAGRAALASDASTAWGNPAGMTRLEGSQLLFGLQPLIVTTEFDVGTGTTTTGTNGGNAGSFIPSGGLYGVYEVMPDLKIGAALNSYAGGSLNYDDNWVGRFFTTETELLTFNLNPVIAYRALPWLSLAAGFSVQYAELKQELATPNLLDPAADGRMKYQDHNFGFGGNIGALFEIDALTRVGLTYRSQVDQSFDDVPSFSRVPTVTRSLGVDMTIPQEVMLSAFRQVTDDLALMANFDWQNWGQFGQFNVGLSGEPPRSKAFDANLDDTFQAAVGAHYRLGAPTMLQLGFAYDSSAADEAQRTPSLPVDQQLRFAAGVTYAVTDDYTLGFAYEYVSLGSASLDTTRGPLSGTVQGDYSTNTLNVIGFSVNHRF
jgi:long-chain fatty acid transport protein